MSDNHRVRIEFGDGNVYAKLICPDEGCETAVTCGECHRHVDDDERSPCEACKDGLGDHCVLADWFGDLGTECLTGMVDLDVTAVDWDYDEGPTVHVELPAAR
jgi:hypothetical protein